MHYIVILRSVKTELKLHIITLCDTIRYIYRSFVSLHALVILYKMYCLTLYGLTSDNQQDHNVYLNVNII